MKANDSAILLFFVTPHSNVKSNKVKKAEKQFFCCFYIFSFTLHAISPLSLTHNIFFRRVHICNFTLKLLFVTYRVEQRFHISIKMGKEEQEKGMNLKFFFYFAKLQPRELHSKINYLRSFFWCRPYHAWGYCENAMIKVDNFIIK